MKKSFPFIEDITSDETLIRRFSKDVDESELLWHWDEESRLVEPVNVNDWMFQFDNELPQKINKQIFIPAGVIHRVIKGNTDLVVTITKFRKK